jgi:N12 class adenine-specific DNA methylase
LQVAEIYQAKAYKKMRDSLVDFDSEKTYQIIDDLKAQGRTAEIAAAVQQHIYKDLPKINKELCYLEGDDFNNYLHDMDFCQR